MIIYRDVFYDPANAREGDELCGDSFQRDTTLLFDGAIMKVKTERVTITEGEINIGSNPSGGAGYGGEAAEREDDDAPEEPLAPGAQVVNNLVHNHRLVQTHYTKDQYKTHIRAYMKKLLDYLKEKKPERVEGFKNAAQEFVKKVLADFDEVQYEFYTGESMDPEAQVLLKFYEQTDKGEVEYFYLWKDGLFEQKV